MNKKNKIKLAMLGMVDGNGHPFLWSALCNGYDRDEMSNCPFPAIPIHLVAVPKDKLRIPDVQVTHVWADDKDNAEAAARAALIPNVVEHPEDVIGKVDAVCIPTDKGWEHVDRVKPFIEADVPIFVDRPLCDKEEDLAQFMKWYADGIPILSSSSSRYAEEIHEMIKGMGEVGDMRLVSGCTAKSWERHGIQALEGLLRIVGPGFLSVRNVGAEDRNIVIIRHRSGADCVVYAYKDGYGGSGSYQVIGTEGIRACKVSDKFHALRGQLEAFLEFARTRTYPFPPEETFELIRIIIAGIRSRTQGGTETSIADIASPE